MTTPNVIPDRIAAAMRSYPPFSMLPEEAVSALAQQARVRAYSDGDSIWEQGDPPTEDVLFLARGRVEYVWTVDDRLELVDVRDIGDLLGLTALIEGAPFRVSAQVVEESLVYILPGVEFKRLLDANDTARNYVRRHLFWATRVGGTVKMPGGAGDPLEGKRTILQAHLDGAQVVRPRPVDRLLSCLPDESIRSAADRMAERKVSSILVVNEERHPIGIVTSNDLVRKVIVANIDYQDPIHKVMSSPVYTIRPNRSATAAVLLMLRERIGQICITEDGTTNSPALDVCTHKDLLTQSGHHPAGLLREIRLARSVVRLRELCDEVESITRSYLESGVSAIFLGQICAELYDELVHRLVELSREELEDEGVELPDVPWAWITVGSDGRREQILRTDMDNAFVFGASRSAEQDEANRRIFLRLAEKVVQGMVDCGFSRCQGGVMASNPRWCRTNREWIDEIKSYADASEGDRLLRALILFDLRFVTGDAKICSALRTAVFDTVAENPTLQRQIAEAAVETPPPLNFWGKFVVEKKGGKEGLFDIKARGLSPLRDGARILALKYRLTRHYSTGGRLEELHDRVPHLREMARLAYDGYDSLLRLRTLTGLSRGDAGRYFEPSSLSKLERAHLANVFDVQRMVQQAVRSEFHLESRGR